MAQDIGMQIERLEKIVEDLYKTCTNNLGDSHRISKKALKTFLYFQGLNCDWKKAKVSNS